MIAQYRWKRQQDYNPQQLLIKWWTVPWLSVRIQRGVVYGNYMDWICPIIFYWKHRFEQGEFNKMRHFTYRCPICCLKIMISWLNHICIHIDGFLAAKVDDCRHSLANAMQTVWELEVTAMLPQSSLTIAAFRLCLQIYNGWLSRMKIRWKYRLAIDIHKTSNVILLLPIYKNMVVRKLWISHPKP